MKKQLYQVQKVNIIMYQLSFASMCVHCPFSVLKTFAPLAHPFFLKPVPPSFSPILPHAVLSLLPQGRILGSMAPWGPGHGARAQHRSGGPMGEAPYNFRVF